MLVPLGFLSKLYRKIMQSATFVHFIPNCYDLYRFEMLEICIKATNVLFLMLAWQNMHVNVLDHASILCYLHAEGIHGACTCTLWPKEGKVGNQLWSKLRIIYKGFRWGELVNEVALAVSTEKIVHISWKLLPESTGRYLLGGVLSNEENVQNPCFSQFNIYNLS